MKSLSKDKLVHQGFRVEDFVLRALQKDANRKGMSLSNLVNKTLKNYVNCDMYFQELGFLLVSRNFLRKLLNRIEEKHIIEDARQLGATMAREYIYYIFVHVNNYTLIEFLELWFNRFQSYQHRSDNKFHWYCINHDINMNFSVYLREFLRELIQSISNSEVKFTFLTPSGLIFSFEA